MKALDGPPFQSREFVCFAFLSDRWCYYIWLNNEIDRASQKRDQLAKQVEELTIDLRRSPGTKGNFAEKKRSC